MKKLLSIFTATLLVLVFFSFPYVSSADGRVQATKTEDGLTFSVSLEKNVFQIGDEIDFKYSLKNDNDYPLFRYSIPVGEEVCAKLISKDGNQEIFGWFSLLPESRDYSIAANSEETGSCYSYFCYLDDIKILPGEYRLSVSFAYSTKDRSDDEVPPKYDANDEKIELSTDIYFVDGTEKDTDLFVSSIASKNGTGVEGDELQFTSTIRNLSKEDFTGAVSIDFYCDGRIVSTVTETVNIPSDGFVNIDASTTTKALFGSHKICAQLDITTDNDIDTSNNIAKARIIVS